MSSNALSFERVAKSLIRHKSQGSLSLLLLLAWNTIHRRSTIWRAWHIILLVAILVILILCRRKIKKNMEDSVLFFSPLSDTSMNGERHTHKTMHFSCYRCNLYASNHQCSILEYGFFSFLPLHSCFWNFHTGT